MLYRNTLGDAAFVIFSSTRKAVVAVRRIPKTSCFIQKMRGGDSSLNIPGKFLTLPVSVLEANSSGDYTFEALGWIEMQRRGKEHTMRLVKDLSGHCAPGWLLCL